MRKFLSILILLLMAPFSAIAAEEIGIEFKEYDNTDAFIFYHPSYFKLKVTYVGGVVRVQANYPIKFRKLTPVSFQAHAEQIISSSSKNFSFKTKDKYASFEVVEGEKLTALKFKTDKVFKKVDYKVNALNKQNHEVQGLQRESLPKIETSQAEVKKSKDEITVKLNFGVPVSGAAFVRGNKVWLAFDKKHNFEFPDMGDLKPPIFLDKPDATLMYFDIPEGLGPEISREQNTWILKFLKKPSDARVKYKIEKLLDHYGMYVNSENFVKEIKFTDPIVGDEVSMITTSKHREAAGSNHFLSDFAINKSLVGVAVSWATSEYKLEFTKKGVMIYSLNNALFSSKGANEEEIPVDYSNTTIPFKFKVEGISEGFIYQRAALYRRLALSEPDKLNEEKYNLARFLFANELFQEAVGVLSSIENSPEFILKHPEYPLVYGVTLTIMRQNHKALEILKNLITSTKNPVVKAEAEIWSAYNKFVTGEKIKEIEVSKYLDGFIEKYPDYAYWKLIFAEFDTASDNNDLQLVEQLFRRVKTPKIQKDIDSLNFYKATFYRKNKKYTLANNYYDSIKINYYDAYNYVRSEFDQVDMLIKLNQIENNEAISKLSKLKYLWRGDQLEYNVLLKIAELQQTTQDFVRSLRSYKYLLTAFPKSQASLHISHQMAEIYNNFIFSEGGIAEKLTDFELVALYYEFQELTPIGPDGDKVVLQVARRMIRLDLLDEAEKILNHQVKYRLSGKDKIVNGDHLAAIYIINKKPQLAIDILNETDLVNFGYLEHLERQRVKAKAYIDLGEYKEALKILSSDDSESARFIKEECYFKLADWENFILLAESAILPVIEIGKTLPERLEREALRLAISYSMLGKTENINFMSEKLKTTNPALEKAIKLIGSTNETIDIQKLESDFKVDEVEENFKNTVNLLFDLK